MKRILTLMLVVSLLTASVVAPTTSASAASNGTLQISFNPNVQSIKITYNDTSTTYTSTTYIQVPQGVTVSWTATCASGYAIKGGNSGSFTMTSYYQLAPTAEKVTTYPLSISFNPNVASISVTMNGTTTRYTSSTVVNINSGTAVSWTATAATGYELSASSGSFTMTDAKLIAPTATIKSYNLNVTLNTGVASIYVNYGYGNQTFTSSGSLSVHHGSNISWTATASTGYNLSASSGSFTMTGANTIAPTASLNSYVLTVTVNPGVSSVKVTYGSSSKTFTSSGTLSISHGTSISWTATAATGYNLSTSSGGFTMTGANTIEPSASLKTYTVTITVNPGVDYVIVNGVRYTSSSTITCNYGQSVSWQASAKTGYTLASTSGSFTVDSAKTIAPTASLNSYVLTVTVNPGVSSVKVTYGSSSKTFTSSGTLSISHGTSVSWTATASTGYTLSVPSGSFVLSSNMTISPTTTVSTYKLTVTVKANVASITVTYGSSTKTFTSSGSLTIEHGTSVSWTGKAKTGYKLSASSGSFTMTGAKTIAPTASIRSYKLTITINEGVDYIVVNGTSYTASTSISLKYGTSVSWEASAKAGYTLSSSSGSFTMTGAKTISPTATLNTYTVQFFVNGSVAKTVTVNYGEKVSSFTPNVVGYDFGGWYSNSGLTNAFDFSSSITSNVTIYAKTTVKTFTISVTSFLPANADPQFGWKLEWASGKALPGAVSEYVTLTVASDKLSVTLTFKQDFTGGEMILTCYAVADPTVKATVRVTCRS